MALWQCQRCSLWEPSVEHQHSPPLKSGVEANSVANKGKHKSSSTTRSKGVFFFKTAVFDTRRVLLISRGFTDAIALHVFCKNEVILRTYW
jgi:hypothetical protein